MPLPIIAGVALGLILRKVAMAVATGAVVTGGEKLLDGTVKQLVYEIKDKEGVTELTAKDVVGDMLADLATNSALILVSLQAGVGVKAAEWLGLTSKGVIKAGSKTVAKKALTGKAAEVALKVAGPWEKFRSYSLINKLLSVAGLGGAGVWMASSIANAVEPGIYKPREANDLWESIIGVRPFPEKRATLTPGPFTATSSVTFNDYANSIEAQGITGLKNPIKLQSILYSREELADIVDFVYGEEVTKGKTLSVKELIPKLAQYLVIPKGYVGTSTTPGASVSNAPTTKVFTGIVSQGVVGKGLVFTPRPDDLIESAEEMRSAAANNLAPFLAALPGKIVYEVKVVSSIITKDGFKQTGTTQRVKTGTYSNGTPKYKTVTNKFATLVVYALTDKGSRAKLTTIVLGPTDSAKLTVAQNDLRTLEGELPALVTTTDINEIKGIETATDVKVTTPTEKKEITETKNNIDETLDTSPTSQVKYTDPFTKIPYKNYYTFLQKNPTGSSDPKVNKSSTSAPATVSVVTSNANATSKAGAGAATLFEWYQAQGQALPSVSARASTYEGLGLGPRSYYTGTSEQNTKLLKALKSGTNVTTSPPANYSGYIDNNALGVS